MGRVEDPACLRCRAEHGTYIHTLWEFGHIQPYWHTIVGELNRILGANIEMDVKFLLLGIPTDIDLPRYGLLLANLGLVVAKRDIAKYWGAQRIPTLTEWKSSMDLYMAAEKVVYRARGCPRKFRKIWSPWLKYYKLDLDVEEEAHTLSHVRSGSGL